MIRGKCSNNKDKEMKTANKTIADKLRIIAQE